MKERETPEFKERAQEFIKIVYNLADRYPTTFYSAVNLTDSKKKAFPILIEWYKENGFSEFIPSVRDDLRAIDFESKYKTTVEVAIEENSHRVLERFIGEIRELAVCLGGEEIPEPLFTDWDANPPAGYRFTSVKTFEFNLSTFA